MGISTEQALEARILGYILEYEEEQDEYVPRLNLDDFEHYKTVYRKAEKLYNSEDEKLDVVTLYKQVEGHNIQDIVRSAPEPSKIESIFSQLKDISRRRKLERKLKPLIDDIIQGDEPVHKRISELEDKILEISEDAFSTDSLQYVKEMTDDLVEHLDELYKNEGLVGVPSGLTDLDNEIGGWEDGEMVILGARPGAGKTDSMIQWMLHSAFEGFSTVTFSVEMPKQDILKRVLSQMTGINRKRIRRGKYSKKEHKRMIGKIDQLREAPLQVDDESNTVDEIRYRLHKAVRKGECDIAFLDYIGAIKTEYIRGGSMQDRYREVSRQFMEMRKRLGIPIIILSQLNRAPMGRESKRPRKSDLRNTGGLEQDADTVVLLHRPAEYDPDENDPSKTEYIIDKQRHGPSGLVEANYDPQTGKFSDVKY